MPVVSVNISPDVFLEVSQLVEDGTYSSHSQFLAVAVSNQLALEADASREAASQHGGMASTSNKKAAQSATLEPSRIGTQPRAKPTTSKSSLEPFGRIHGRDLEEVLGRLSLKVGTSVPRLAKASPGPSDERIWGQVNRLLPIKLACRWLAVANAGKPEWFSIRALADRLANDAAIIGSALEAADHEKKRKRDDQQAIGLPRMGNAASRDRFVSQFVARLTRSGEIRRGAVVQYALADLDEGRLRLTDLGLSLARLANPVLDQRLGDSTETLSNAERLYFINSVLPHVPGEIGDLVAAVEAVVSGNTAPPALLAATRTHLPSAWTDTMVQTHISGVVARLIDLGALAREWNGKRVRYMPGATLRSLLEAGTTSRG